MYLQNLTKYHQGRLIRNIFILCFLCICVRVSGRPEFLIYVHTKISQFKGEKNAFNAYVIQVSSFPGPLWPVDEGLLEGMHMKMEYFVVCWQCTNQPQHVNNHRQENSMNYLVTDKLWNIRQQINSESLKLMCWQLGPGISWNALASTYQSGLIPQ